MNYRALTDFLAKRILRRPKMLATDKEALQTAIDMAHWQVQRDADWRCMEASADLTYLAGSRTGVTSMPADYKRTRQVWAGSCTTERIPIKRATEEEVNRLIGDAYRGARITEDDLAHKKYEQRWYEKEEKIYLLLLPTNHQSLLLDYYRFLQPYSGDGDEDYFGQKLFDVLLFGAAMLGSMSLWEDDRGETFAKTYEFLKARALALDQQIKAGGADGFYSTRGLKAAAVAPAAA